MRNLLLAGVLLAPALAAAEGDAWNVVLERPRNPDRWTMIEFDQSGLAAPKSDQIVAPPGKPETDSTRRSYDVTASAFALFPLADDFSALLGAGGDWAEASIANAGGSGSSVADTSLATYQAGARYYWENPESHAWLASYNPDRWPSLGLNASGTQTTNFSAGTAAGNNEQTSASNTQTLVLDARVPVADAWTLTGGGGASRSESKLVPSPGAAATVTLTGTEFFSAGFRYYLVGRNLILKDAHENPDMWSMFWLTASMNRSFYGRQTLGAGERSPVSRGGSATAGTRLPITDRASLDFSAQLQYSRSYVPPLGPAAGVLTRTTSFVFSGGVRWFLF